MERMFQTTSADFVKTICGDNSKIDGAHVVYSANSINEGSRVHLGTFAIKTKKEHFWQSTSCKLMFPCAAPIDKASGTNVVKLLEDYTKQVDLTEKNSFNLSALKQMGVDVEVDYEYSISAPLGPVNRHDLNRKVILDHSVPASIVDKVASKDRRVLGLVTSVYVLPNSCQLSLSRDLSIDDKVSLAKTFNEGDENVFKKKVVSSLKLVAGQVIAYEVQECNLDVDAQTFSFPLDTEKATETKAADETDQFIWVQAPKDLQESEIETVVNDLSQLGQKFVDQLLKLMKSAFINSLNEELRSFFFELEDAVAKKDTSISVKDFDCANAQLLALIDFVSKSADQSFVLQYLLYVLQYAQELSTNVLMDVSSLNADFVDAIKNELLLTLTKCVNLDSNLICISEKSFGAAPVLWKDLFVLEKQCADEVVTFNVTGCKLSTSEYYVFDKFIKLFIL